MEDEKNQNVDTQTTAESTQKQEQKSESKNEGEKTKKQVAKKGENGSIVFKNQDELDGFIRRMYAKGAEKAEQGKTSEQTQENKEELQQEKKGQETQEEGQNQESSNESFMTEIALAMTEADVIPKKARRAAKLVDLSKVIVNGAIDPTKLQEEINAVIAEFPELKNTTQEEKEEKGFKFGATESSSNTSQKTKKSIPTKRWNRFNSF